MTPNEVLKFICKYFNLSETEIKKRTRKKEYVFPRKLYMYFGKIHCTKYSLKNIGNEVGYDHATVLHHYKGINNLLDVKDKITVVAVSDITQLLNQVLNNEQSTFNISLLKINLETIIEKYVIIFCKKHDFEFYGWVGNKVGEIGCFNDYFFDLRDIRYDLENNQPENMLIQWYDESLKQAMNKKPVINYETFCTANTKKE